MYFEVYMYVYVCIIVDCVYIYTTSSADVINASFMGKKRKTCRYTLLF